jgi:chloramphenicol O-acetyltransferase type A
VISEIDIESWERRDTYRFFKDYDDPFFGITAPVDVTRLYGYCKEKGESFFLHTLYVLTRAVNEIPAFRLRIFEDRVLEYKVVHGGTTALRPDNTFTFCYFDYLTSREAFIRAARKEIDDQLAGRTFDPRDHELDRIHFSVIPWVAFSHFKNPKKAGSGDSIPKIVFGKYFEAGDRIQMPLAVEVHHALADGYHVGLYFEKVQELLDQMEK